MTDLEVLAEGKHLQFVRRDRWEYVTRNGASGVVVVAALTQVGNVLLVEQFRAPVGRRVIELPAGLSGDVEGAADEPLAQAAQRELIEETGYRAAELRHVFTGPSSAGLTDEIVAIFVAAGLTRVAEGGGVEGESIVVHEVPLPEIDSWLEARAREGYLIDVRVYTGLYFLRPVNTRKGN
jgi:ADP-ribose pyrophosphatase